MRAVTAGIDPGGPPLGRVQVTMVGVWLFVDVPNRAADSCVIGGIKILVGAVYDPVLLGRLVGRARVLTLTMEALGL
jgi:hypothetical protein